MTIADLIKKLQEQDRTQEVEAFVVKPSGEVITANFSARIAKKMIPILKRFTEGE